MKKIIAILLVLSLTVCMFSGCTLFVTTHDSSSTVSEAVSEVETNDGPYKIGLVQYVEDPSLDAVREAFISRLEEWGYGESMVEIDYQNAAGDEAAADTICGNFVTNEVDMIVAISTPAAKAAVEAANDTDIKVLYAAANSTDTLTTAENTTGTAYDIPVTSVIDLALKADPEIKNFGILYSTGDTASADAAEKAKAYCESKSITVVASPVADTSELQKTATDLCAQVDAIFTPADSGIASSAAAVAETTRTAEIPWYVSTDALVQSGALAGISIDYSELGRANADMAVQLIEGKTVAEVPPRTFTAYATYINQTTLNSLPLTFPEDVLSAVNYLG